MAPKKMKQVALKPTMVKNMGVRFQAKRVKAKLGKIIYEQETMREEQRRIRVRFGEFGRRCDQLKEETEMIMKQSARTQIKVVLMFRILKARESGDSMLAATLTQFLRKLHLKEQMQSSEEVKNKEDPQLENGPPITGKNEEVSRSAHQMFN